MPRWLNLTLFIFIALYLAVGALFAAMPLLFGAYKAAALMLVAWPLVFIK
jgi:hypothetical protein